MVNLSIIVLNYNTKELTLACIESLIDQYKRELENDEIEVILVDNASKDNSVTSIKKKILGINNISIIENEENLGFAKGCNIGVKKSKGKYILFLNSDTQVLGRGFLKMTEFLDANSTIGILGGKLLNPDSSPQPSAGKFYTLFNLFLMLTGAEVFLGIRKSPRIISKVDWVSGGCMMIKKSLFEKLSGFDENFFMYIEDMEMCFRADKLGFKTYFYPDIKVVHKTLGSSSRDFAIINIYKGILYFYSKHKSHIEYIVAKVLLVAKAAFLIFVGIIGRSRGLKDRYEKALKVSV